MPKLIIVILFILTLGGCITPYGNFIPSSSIVDQQPLAYDAVQQLITLHPPAKTHLELQQPTPDPLGQILVRMLRESGYALLEFDRSSKSSSTVATNGLPLWYVLNPVSNSSLYHLTLFIGSQSITRAYSVQDDHFIPAGYWTFKE